jgi:membrane-bound metal-dependent hydrolase YbcI (DUF457 family)
MDPVMHLLLPLLILLALRIDTRSVLLFAPLAILPDFDAFLGLHRVVFHSFIPVIVIPVMLILYSKYRRPEWMLGALLVQFYMASHVALDMGGVVFLWPFTMDMFYVDPQLRFNMQGGLNFDWHFKAGVMEYQEMGETDFIAESTFGFLILIAIAAVIYRKEALAAIQKAYGIFRKALMRD